ncbi:MAG: 1-acyl-sn-glycerol-3-phosphate acyltransferase [Spirochaeta sp.]|nr:1-acyl-sn-glycerol-3-phosphate acyltransferase [Spirochaeta sp.]
MSPSERILSFSIRAAFRLLCRMDVKQLQRIPRYGAVVLATNHIGNLDGPLFYSFLRRQKKTGIAKRELWEHPLTGYIMRIWDLIPIDRGETDRETIRRCFKALDDGYLLGIAPEGTRSRTGILGTGHPGAVYIAGAKKLPIYPVAHWGTSEVLRKLTSFRRPNITIRVGQPFFLEKPGGGKVGVEDRTRMLDEMMYQLAVLLPPQYRGAYADMSRMTTDYIRYLDVNTEVTPPPA